MTQSAIRGVHQCYPGNTTNNGTELTPKYAGALAKAFAKNLGYTNVARVWHNTDGVFAELNNV
jgi:hypothetical protein